MKMHLNQKAIIWAPRITSIVFATFLSLFALDIFNEGYNFKDTLIALLIHLVPTYIVIIFLIIAWRWENIGGILSIGLSFFYLITNRGGGLILFVPLFLIGILFMFSWYHAFRHKP